MRGQDEEKTGSQFHVSFIYTHSSIFMSSNFRPQWPLIEKVIGAVLDVARLGILPVVASKRHLQLKIISKFGLEMGPYLVPEILFT